jgi:hypothetical protein
MLNLLPHMARLALAISYNIRSTFWAAAILLLLLLLLQQQLLLLAADMLWP